MGAEVEVDDKWYCYDSLQDLIVNSPANPKHQFFSSYTIDRTDIRFPLTTFAKSWTRDTLQRGNMPAFLV